MEKKSTLEIMKYIMENNIVNVKYFITNELNLNYTNFKKKLLTVEKKYPEIYLEYNKILNDNYNKFKENAKNIFLYILILKKYGIELEDGTFRNFDLFDYYVIKNKYLENFSKIYLLPIYEELLKEVTGYFNSLNTLEVRFLISTTAGFNHGSYDSLDLPISKESILKLEDELTIEEKEYLIDFMDNNKIPFTFGNYNFGIEKIKKQRNNKNDIFNIKVDLNEVKKENKIKLVIK